MSWWVGCGDIYYNYDLRPAERVNECPYCGAARINGLIGTIPECGHRTTIYECGSQFVVNHTRGWFAAVKSVSVTCEMRSKLLCSSDDVT